MTDSGDATTSRRDAIKKAAAAAATAGVVWTAPRIEGLSLRPNYAAASSVAVNWTGTITMPLIFGGEPIAGIVGPSIDEATVTGSSSSMSPALFAIARVRGTGLEGGSLTIDGVSTDAGPLNFTSSKQTTTGTLLQTAARGDAVPTFPLFIRGRFFCA